MAGEKTGYALDHDEYDYMEPSDSARAIIGEFSDGTGDHDVSALEAHLDHDHYDYHSDLVAELRDFIRQAKESQKD